MKETSQIVRYINCNSGKVIRKILHTEKLQIMAPKGELKLRCLWPEACPGESALCGHSCKPHVFICGCGFWISFNQLTHIICSEKYLGLSSNSAGAVPVPSEFCVNRGKLTHVICIRCKKSILSKTRFCLLRVKPYNSCIYP